MDADNIHSRLNSSLRFSEQERVENIRPIGEDSKLKPEADLFVITAFIPQIQADPEIWSTSVQSTFSISSNSFVPKK